MGKFNARILQGGLAVIWMLNQAPTLATETNSTDVIISKVLISERVISSREITLETADNDSSTKTKLVVVLKAVSEAVVSKAIVSKAIVTQQPTAPKTEAVPSVDSSKTVELIIENKAAGKTIVEAAADKATVVEPIEIQPIVTAPRPLFQHSSYPDAWRAAQISNRPILVYVSMPNCAYCVKMKNQVYKLPHITDLVSNSFETIHVGRYTHAKLVQKLHIKWYPTTVLVGPNNKILDVIEGYAEANQFQQRLYTGIAKQQNQGVMTRLR